MKKTTRPSERKITKVNEEFIDKNLYRIDEFLDSQTAKRIADKYYTKIEIHKGELVSDLFLALRRMAVYCNCYENAFLWYGPVVLSHTLEEYFQMNIQNTDKLRDPWKRKRLEEKGRSILLVQRQKYIEQEYNTHPFKVLDCKKISRLIRQAGLTKMQIRVFLLKARKDMDFRQISKKINRSLCTVRAHYYRAINKMKKYTNRTHLEIEDIYRTLTKQERTDLK